MWIGSSPNGWPNNISNSSRLGNVVLEFVFPHCGLEVGIVRTDLLDTVADEAFWSLGTLRDEQVSVRKFFDRHEQTI